MAPARTPTPTTWAGPSGLQVIKPEDGINQGDTTQTGQAVMAATPTTSTSQAQIHSMDDVKFSYKCSGCEAVFETEEAWKVHSEMCPNWSKDLHPWLQPIGLKTEKTEDNSAWNNSSVDLSNCDEKEEPKDEKS